MALSDGISGPSDGSAAGRLRLQWLPGQYAICRLPCDSAMPDWARISAGFVSITRTDEEISIIARQDCVPHDDPVLRIEPGWVAMRVAGTLDFNLVGVLARLSGALAAAGVPMCAVSTFDTDILLVKAENEHRAEAALGEVAVFDNSQAETPKEELA